ncbi:hypothetical protein ES707_20922 [subsurface metagenome]
MLCSLSASLINTTRRSSAIAISIFLRFSACDSRDATSIGAGKESLPSLVVPSTSLATSEPNLASISEIGIPQFSGTSCNKAAARELASS